MASHASEGITHRHRSSSTQSGSTRKKWDNAELLRCRAIGTTEEYTLDLSGEIHPVFANWIHAEYDDDALHRELQQPLLLASKILEATGLPWLSDFFINGDDDDDLFNEPCTASHDYGGRHDQAPPAIIRQHRASWAPPELKQKWLDNTRCELRCAEFARSVEWRLDATMFGEKGWVGYTCRHPRTARMELDQLDEVDTIAEFDGQAPDCDDSCNGDRKKYRKLSVLVMAEFPARLRELRRLGKEGGEEYLLTAFMAAVTILHELGHIAYWTNQRRPLIRDLKEPFYGADLEMELGDSFIASLFGGWIPSPIEDITRRGPTFDAGIAWRQSLSWDYHRIRPKYRAHYSIPVEYIAQLFREESWSSDNDLKNLIQPQVLAGRDSRALKAVGLLFDISPEEEHATAAIPDFHRSGEGWRWNRRAGALFRIPQYDGYLCPEIDLPFAIEDVIKEREPCPPPTPSSSTLTTAARKEDNVSLKNQNRKPRLIEIKPFPTKTVVPKIKKNRDKENVMLMSPPSKKEIFGHIDVATDMMSLECCEISLDELKNRLSQLIGVSMGELEKLFETTRCSEVDC